MLRPSVVFGAEDQFLNLFARLQVLAPFVPLAGAEARFQPVWVEDVATAVVRCLALGGSAASQSAPRVIEACGPEVFTLRQLVQLHGVAVLLAAGLALSALLYTAALGAGAWWWIAAPLMRWIGAA